MLFKFWYLFIKYICFLRLSYIQMKSYSYSFFSRTTKLYFQVSFIYLLFFLVFYYNKHMFEIYIFCHFYSTILLFPFFVSINKTINQINIITKSKIFLKIQSKYNRKEYMNIVSLNRYCSVLCYLLIKYILRFTAKWCFLYCAIVIQYLKIIQQQYLYCRI